MSYLADPVRASAKPQTTVQPGCLPRAAVILVVEDTPRLSHSLGELCSFLRIGVQTVTGNDDLGRCIREARPMAVVAEMDSRSQDGGYVMMRIAEYDRALPLLLLTGGSPVLVGAAEAIEELCDLSAVARHSFLPEIGELVEFLFRAGQSGGCLGLMPA